MLEACLHGGGRLENTHAICPVEEPIIWLGDLSLGILDQNIKVPRNVYNQTPSVYVCVCIIGLPDEMGTPS